MNRSYRPRTSPKEFSVEKPRYGKRGFDKRGYDKAKKRPPKAAKPEEKVEKDESLILAGKNSVLEALAAETPIDRILIRKSETPLEGTLKVISAKAKECGIVVSEVVKEKLDKTCEENEITANHQGVLALCPAFPYCQVEDILAASQRRGEPPLIIILDEISDPRNLGAIIRAADGSGAHGVIIPKRRACGLTATVVKASAGAAAHVKIARVGNITETIKTLKKQGIWIACADVRGESLYKAPLEGALAIVIGNEGEGAGELVRKNCDFLVKIPMFGKVQSLNAASAASVVLYEIIRRKIMK